MNLLEEHAIETIVHSFSLHQLIILKASEKIQFVWMSIIEPLLNDNQRLTLDFLQGDTPLYQMKDVKQIEATVKAITYYIINEKEVFPLIKAGIDNLTMIFKFPFMIHSEASAALAQVSFL